MSFITNKRDYKYYKSATGCQYRLYRAVSGGYWNVHVNMGLRVTAEIYPIRKHGCRWKLIQAVEQNTFVGRNLAEVLLLWEKARLAREIFILERGDNFAYTQNPDFKELLKRSDQVSQQLRSI